MILTNMARHASFSRLHRNTSCIACFPILHLPGLQLLLPAHLSLCSRAHGPTSSRAHAATGPPRAHGSTGPGPAGPSAEKTMAGYTLLCAREHFRKVGEMFHSRRSVSGLAGPLQSELGEPCETCQQLLLLESSLSGVFWNCTLCSRNRSSICVRHLLIACAVVRTTSRDAF